MARAEATGLPAHCADLVIAAQAFPWFDPGPFERELARIARPGALFAAFTYALCRVEPNVDAIVDEGAPSTLSSPPSPEARHGASGPSSFAPKERP